jgi:DNA-binding NarL/FixJ family response regulator
MDNGGVSGLGLSSEEQRIVALVLAGYKNIDIARHLSLSDSTVCRRIVRVLGKLGVSNRFELTLFVVDRQRFAGAHP